MLPRFRRPARVLTVALAGLMLLATAAFVQPAQAALPYDRPAFDYTKITGLSEPTHQIERKTFEVTAFDGVKLYVEVVKPTAAGRFPVILEASPYHGTIADRDGTRIFPASEEDGTLKGLTGYFAPRGYAVVMMDLRGTGRSEGCLDHLGPNDGRDLKTVVEWAASQPWSTGRVGMTGHSYVGSTPMVAAAQNPKGLVTIAPSAGLASMYHHQFQHGVPFWLQWAGPQWAYEYLAMARHFPPLPVKEPVQNGNTGDNFGNDMQYFGCGWTQSALTSGPDAQTSGQYVAWHRARDWGLKATQAKIPMFLIHGVNDNAARISAADWFHEREAYWGTIQENPKRPLDKVWIGNWDHGSGAHVNRRYAQWTRALHAWFDRHLQQRSITTGPYVELFLPDGTFAQARTGRRDNIAILPAWPNYPDYLRFHTNSAGNKLQGGEAPAAGSASFTGTPAGFALVTPPTGTMVEFASDPIEQDRILAGVPKMDLVASVSAPRVHLIATLYDRWTEGTATITRRITQFSINPELRNGADTHSAIVPGEKYAMRPEDGFAMAHYLRQGHRLVLRVTTSDPDKAPIASVDPRVTVFTGDGGTAIDIPVARTWKLAKDDVPMSLGAGTIAVAPAQPTIRHTYMPFTAAPGADPPASTRACGVTSVCYEFTTQEEFDNASAALTVLPTAPADLDLYLFKDVAGTWAPVVINGGGSSALDKEAATTNRLYAGKYRLEIHNWAGPPVNQVALEIQFFNQNGELGTTPG